MIPNFFLRPNIHFLFRSDSFTWTKSCALQKVHTESKDDRFVFAVPPTTNVRQEGGIHFSWFSYLTLRAALFSPRTIVNWNHFLIYVKMWRVCKKHLVYSVHTWIEGQCSLINSPYHMLRKIVWNHIHPLRKCGAQGMHGLFFVKPLAKIFSRLSCSILCRSCVTSSRDSRRHTDFQALTNSTSAKWGSTERAVRVEAALQTPGGLAVSRGLVLL